METEFAEEEVVENPTLKAAYNLAPLHQNQPLRWDYEVNLIGKKVFDKALHLCEICELPILVYGRLLPCKHIFCFHCARKCEPHCKRCIAKVQKVEELALGTVYVCTHGAPKHSTKGCRRTYLSQRDLQSHIAHRHMSKSSSESKTSQSTQPQLPLTQQQAAALQHVSQTAPTHSQSCLLPTSSQQVLSSAPVIPSLGGLSSPKDSGQHLNSVISDLGDIRSATASESPVISQASPDPKSTLMHGMGFNPSSHSNEQGIYRSLDVPSLPHQLQQQQHQLQLQQYHQLQPTKQQPQPSQMMRLSSSPGMTPMSKPLLRFNQPPQIPLSSSLIPPQSSHLNPFQVTSSGSPSEMRMSTQIHHQQSPNLHQQQQQHLSGMMHPRNQTQLLMQKNMDQMHTDMEMGDFNNRQNVDDFGNMQNMDNLHGVQNIDNFSSMSQRKPFNNMQDIDNFNTVQKMESYNSPQNRDDFNTMQGGIMDASKAPPNSQGGLSRNKNVNLITVPIQDEGQYRPLPYVGQSQFPPGAINNNNIPFSSNMPVSNNPSNFSPLMDNQTMRGGGGIKTSPRMQFNRPGNPQARLSQPGNPPMQNPGLMMNLPRGGGGISLGGNMPPSVQGALAGVVQAITRAKGGSSGGPGGMQGGMMRTPGPMNAPHNRFNTPQTATHWTGNLRSIQPRMTQNSPRSKGDPKFQQNYFG